MRQRTVPSLPILYNKHKSVNIEDLLEWLTLTSGPDWLHGIYYFGRNNDNWTNNDTFI